MKKIILGLIFLVFGAGLLFLFLAKSNSEQSEVTFESVGESLATATIANLSFSYNAGLGGYVLVESTDTWPENLVSNYTLYTRRDYEWFSKPDFLGEAPPSFGVSVFKNPDNLSALEWAETNPLASNIELIQGTSTEVEVGGKSGISYTVNGLYLIDTYILTYGDEVYLLYGSYFEVGDSYHQAFLDMVSTVAFN